MKVYCSSIEQLVANRPYEHAEMVQALRPVLGKFASVTVADAAKGADAATGADLVAAAQAAFAIDPSAEIVGIALILKNVEVDMSKTLESLGIKDGSSAQIRFTVSL